MLRNLWAFRSHQRVPVHWIHRSRPRSSTQCGILWNSSRAVSTNDTPSDQKKRSLPPLMDFPEIVWPTVFKSMRNWILVNFIIRPYIDREFSMPDFVLGAKQALQAVSTKLSDGDTTDLTDLLSRECATEITASIRKMSVAQRHEIRVIKEDVYFSFPYQVGIIFDDDSGEETAAQKRWVEITMIFHALRGLRDMQERGETPPINLGLLPDYRDKISICNYRFIKEFTKGKESDWTINVVNHFKPNDLLDE
ncbi:m-AAA protease-interacting protein 1, mitochondrial [Lutzomyia longipalpis]|nr:m-AAA protease-interacting protein 1, mitochondrial [Lutzomyia longipalpis]